MTNPLEKEEASSYRTPGSVVSSVSSIIKKISALKAEVINQAGDYEVESLGGTLFSSAFDEIIEEVTKVHVDFMEDHLEARFRRIERKLEDG